MPSTVVGPGHVIAGRYRIERWLGQGGMGSVYRAIQLSIQRTVALKRLVDEHLESASHVERFEREALALSRLSHQSTVRLFDFGTDERGCPFIVMEYLDGTDLAVDLDRHGPMRWDQALEVGLQILGSLAEAHAAGIIHRDIKPANLFLCAGPRWPVLKVLDFGIAGGAEPLAGVHKLTLTGTVLGSAPYMSPEQAQGKAVGPAADLYSFGVVLFELLTGKTPFETRTLTAQLLAKVLETAPQLRDACPGLDAPVEVHALVASLLERDPARRPSSARATAERIEALLARASLPALSRDAQRPESRPPPPIAKTEPMLPPRTIGEGWSPPKAASPLRSRLERALGWGVGLAAAVATAALWRALPFEPSPAEPDAAVAATEVVPVSGSEPPSEPPTLGFDARVEPALLPGVEPAGALDAAAAVEGPEPAAPSAKVSSAVADGPPRRRAARPRKTASAAPRATAVSSTVLPPSVSPSAAAEPAPEPTPVTPETLRPPSTAATARPPEPEPEREESAAPPMPREPTAGEASSSRPRIDLVGPSPYRTPPSDPRYWTIAAVQAAARRGEITPAQRNEIVAGLRERRMKARARAARAYRDGRIGFEELLQRQYLIDRRIEGW